MWGCGCSRILVLLPLMCMALMAGGTYGAYICSPNPGRLRISCALSVLDQRLWWEIQYSSGRLTRVLVFHDDGEEGDDLHLTDTRHCTSCTHPYVISLVTPLTINATLRLLIRDGMYGRGEKELCIAHLPTLRDIRTCRVDADLGLLYAVCLILSFSIVAAALWKVDYDRSVAVVSKSYKS